MQMITGLESDTRYVLIAAHNEEGNIGKVMESLQDPFLGPIVIANGCTEDDQTANIARQTAEAVVLERDDAGKLPALQAGLQHLGHRAIGPTILMLDADCTPLYPGSWARYMDEYLQQKQAERPDMPVLAAGINIATGGASRVSNWLRTFREIGRHIDHSLVGRDHGVWTGSNMGLRLTHPDQLEALLELPHYWPGEDVAIKDVIVAQGGTAHQTLSLQSAVLQDSRSHSPITARGIIDRRIRARTIDAEHTARSAAGSIPYPGRSKLL